MTDQGELFDPASTVAPEWCFDCHAMHRRHEPHVRNLDELKAEAEARTREAVARVDHNAVEEWKAAADEAIRHVADHAETFTADEVWWRLDELGIGPPHEPRALGARMQAAARAGIAANTGTVAKSRRPETHGSWVAVWRSLRERMPATPAEGMGP